MGKIFDWIDGKFRVKEPHKLFLERRLPEKLNYFYCLGGAAFTFYLISVVTGIMLSLYYVPSETEAFESIVRIQKEVHFGWLVRSMHKWSANLLIVFILDVPVNTDFYCPHHHIRGKYKWHLLR